MSNNLLLRTSDFCRPRKPPTVQIRVMVWREIPTGSTHSTYDPSSIIYLSMNILRCLCCSMHDFAILSVRDDGGAVIRSEKSVVVRLGLFGEEEETVSSSADAIGSFPPCIVWISPLVAANLGIHWTTTADMHSITVDGWLQACYTPPPRATHITLRPLGQPTSRIWPNFLPSSGQSPRTRRNMQHQENDDSAPSSHTLMVWPVPPHNHIAGKDELLAVYDAKEDSVYYYHVLDVQPYHHPTMAVVTTSSTKYEFDSSPIGDHVPRLPPLRSMEQIFHRHVAKRRGPNENHTPGNQNCIASSISLSTPTEAIRVIPPHPNLTQLEKAFSSWTSSQSREKVIHVIGTTRDHHLQQVIELAAHQVGRTCIAIRGLAAFAAHVHHSVSSGNIVDQLQGLKAAFDLIRHQRLEPCVLHLVEFDTEFAHDDVPYRHEQEDRFWTTWTQGLEDYNRTTVKMNVDPIPKSKASKLLYTTPPLIIVFSTSSPLEPGPLLEQLVFPSIPLNTPDWSYIRYLWNRQLQFQPYLQIDDDSDNDTAATDLKKIQEALQGRTVQSIEWLAEHVHDELCLVEDQQEQGQKLYETLRNACKTWDQMNRRSSSTSAARISNVYWQDIGGLEHVRKEIMDAIELPLRHPHLFPRGGRSGILLYGT